MWLYLGQRSHGGKSYKNSLKARLKAVHWIRIRSQKLAQDIYLYGEPPAGKLLKSSKLITYRNWKEKGK